MKKLSILFLAFMAITSSLFANRTKIGDLYYILNESEMTATVTYYRLKRGYANYSLNQINIPSQVMYQGNTYDVTSVGDSAFCYIYVSTKITIPNSVTSVGKFAFNECEKLYSISLGNGITSIEIGTFSCCKNLRSIEIPNNVTSIGDSAFSGCTGLTSITIPNSVTSIGDYAFYGCHALTSVTIPNSVTSIGKGAFYGCIALTSVTMESTTPPTIGSNVFYNTKLSAIYVPCGTLEAYKSAWSAYSSKIKYAPLPYSITINAANGTVSSSQNSCDALELSVITNYGYYFTRWSDGNTDNPRIINLTKDTIFTAEFAKNTYTITTESNNSTWGTTAGDKSALYQDEVEISATANYGYHFTKWNDGNTDNPRTLTVTEDKTYTATFAKNTYSITKNAEYGSISGLSQAEYLDEVTLTITPNYGYHFVQWSDGNIENPRTFVLIQDTIFTAEFAKNTYTITTESNNSNWGTTAGDKSVLYLDAVEISATANYGYHFVNWNDWNTDNPRTVTVTGDRTYFAAFAKNTYSITTNAAYGSISGPSQAEYLDEVTLTITTNYGYHFTRWSDGNKDNPRTFTLIQDTIFTAEFAIDKSGTCGADNALKWAYDNQSEILTISGNGALTENYTFGIEAPTQMNTLIIGDDVTAIGDSAFYDMSTINHLFIGGKVESIGNYSFAGCKNFDDITCYATVVPTINATTFDNVGNKQYIYLYVPENRERAYKRDTYWSEFDIQIKSAQTTTTNGEVTVQPTDNTAKISWPAVNNADTYELEITKDGEVFCVLKFNANGQLVGIAFAPGRNGANHTQQAQTTGFTFTVTGLTSGTQYGYKVAAKDENSQIVDTKSGSFTTTSATGIDQITNQNGQMANKILCNGQVLILRGDKTYTLTGQEIN